MSRSWLPVALVAVLVVAAVGILASGSQPAYGPVVETVTQGDFELTIRSEKGRYAPDEPIVAESSLTYRGPDDGVQIGHASGAGQSPLGFGIEEPVLGNLRLGPGWDDMCVTTRLTANTPLEQGFQKSAGWSDSDPRATEYRAWVEDPELRLDEGTWHVFAVAEFSIGDCGPAEYKLRAEIAITVESSSPTDLIQPSPTEQANLPQSNTVRNGDLELTIRSDKTRYPPGKPIDVTVALTYVGEEPSIETSGSGAGRFSFAIQQLDGDLEMGGELTADCRPQGAITRGQPITVQWGKGVAFAADDPNADFYREWIRDPTLWLPAGTWTFTVSTDFAIGPGCSTQAPSLAAHLTIVVVDDSAPSATPSPESNSTHYRPLPLIEIPLWTAPEPQKGCYLQYHQGILARHPQSGLGIIEDGTLKAVRWPYWARAIDQDGTAMLLGPDGQGVAHEGDVVSMSGPGGPGSDDVINACEEIGVVVPLEPS